MLKKVKSILLSLICTCIFVFCTNALEASAIDSSVPTSGEFYIVSNLTSSNVVTLDVKTGNVNLWEINRQNNQKWRFEYNRDKHAYKVINSHDGRVLTWTSNKDRNVVGWGSKNFDDQYWIFDEISHNNYVIRNYRNRNMVLDVTESDTHNGTNIGVYEYKGSKNQTFRIEKELAENTKIQLPKTVGFSSGLGQTIFKTQNINNIGFQQYWHSRNHIYTDTYTGYVSYIGENTFEVRTGFFNLNDKLYHSDPETGESSLGYKTIGGKSYFFNPDPSNPYYIENPSLSDIQKAKLLERK